VVSPSYLDGTLAGDYGFDPMGLGANPKMLTWYRQAELQNARWAMLGVAGILGQEVLHPEQWWYTAGMPENLPSFDGNKVNMGECADSGGANRQSATVESSLHARHAVQGHTALTEQQGRVCRIPCNCVGQRLAPAATSSLAPFMPSI